MKKEHYCQHFATNVAHFLQPMLPLRCATAQAICAAKSHLAHLQHSITLQKHENKKLFESNVYFVHILIRFYTYFNNSQSL